MFAKLIQKIGTLADHHQILIAVLISFALICASWGTGRALDRYFLPHKPEYNYIIVIILALFILWLTKHVILHVF